MRIGEALCRSGQKVFLVSPDDEFRQQPRVDRTHRGCEWSGLYKKESRRKSSAFLVIRMSRIFRLAAHSPPVVLWDRFRRCRTLADLPEGRRS